ncbi:MAG TPA: YbaB/EbfC family DNA-binding protein [Mycobacterium sp.]|nr:YbaB/EbfC family DNA-binding protein [Mycobacterium sp.]
MTDDATRRAAWEDGDDDRDGGASALDALGEYSPVSEEEADQVLAALFTVTNPARTVSATAAIGGRLQQIALSANATDMTEAELAEEICVLADLARQKAQAAQHAVIVQQMRSMGHDSVMTSGFLERDMDLPSPETVEARRAEVFAARYPFDDEA